jgi:hypothetical protein
VINKKRGRLYVRILIALILKITIKIIDNIIDKNNPTPIFLKML